MIHHLEFAGWRLAIACDGPVVSTTGAEAIVSAGRLTVLHDMPDALVYRTGQNSWSPAGWRRLGESPMRISDPARRRTADDDIWDDPVRHHSAWLTVLAEDDRSGEEDGRALLVGCLEGDTPRVRADTAALEALTETGSRAEWMIRVGTVTEVLVAYARAAGRHLGRRPIRLRSVWCSWYSYYEDVSQAALEDELDAIASLGVDTLQIDDGWEAAVGDWAPGEHFPDGMAHIATRIRRAGMEPGLWLAPFIALSGSRLAGTRPELFVTGPDGAPAVAGSNWGTTYHALDLTRPEACDVVHETVARAVHEWGFGYLKLDFINAAAIPGRRHEEIDREHAYRRGIGVVRRAAGEEAFLLGSGAPVMPSIGLLDAVRIGPDAAPMWDNYATDDPSDAMALNALRTSVNRLWLGEVIGIDPDVVFFRHRRNLLSDEQMRWLQELAAACRFRCLSDRPAWLDAREKDAVRAFVAGHEDVDLTGRYRFRLDGRKVDLTDAVLGGGSRYPL